MHKIYIFLYGILFIHITPLSSCDDSMKNLIQYTFASYKHLDEGYELVQPQETFHDFLTSKLSTNPIDKKDLPFYYEEIIAQAEYSVINPMKDIFLEIVTPNFHEKLPLHENLLHPYFLYIQKNHCKLSRPLIKEWIDAQDVFGNSLLHKIVNKKINKKKGYESHCKLSYLIHILHVLVDLNANINIVNNNGTSPLHIVHNYELTKILLTAGANPNIQDKQGLTPLHMASRNIQEQSLTKLLLRFGANPNLCDQRGRKPIHEAAEYNNITAIQNFIQNRVDVNSRDNEGLTPLHHAAIQNASDEITQLLIRHNAFIDSQSHAKITPLYLAIQHNHQATVKTLLNAGADLTILNRNSNLKIYKEMYDILKENRNENQKFCTVS